MTEHRPSTHNVIRTLVLLHPTISTDELQHELHGLGINLSKFAVGQFKRSFLDVLRLLRGFDLLRDKQPRVPAWLKQHRRERLKFETVPEARRQQPREEPQPKRFKPWKSTYKKWHFPG